MADLKDLSVEEFAAVTASDSPAPGGGSVAAMAGAVAAALSEMVANLTIGKKGYEECEEEMQKIAKEASLLRAELIAGIQKDASSFNGYMDALSLPKETEEEKAFRREKMQEDLKAAAQVPLESAETAAKVFPYALAVVKSGNKNAVTDGLVSGMLARTAVLSALLNVKINLGSIKDEAFVAEMSAKVDALEKEALRCEAEILKASDLTSSL